MLRKEFKYKNFNDEEVEDVLYFHLSKIEITRLEVDYAGGFINYLSGIAETRDRKALVEFFEYMISTSYGEKSADGKRFIKNDELREAFKQSIPYELLFTELSSDPSAGIDFLVKIMPSDVQPTDEDLRAVKKEAAELVEAEKQRAGLQAVPTTKEV